MFSWKYIFLGQKKISHELLYFAFLQVPLMPDLSKRWSPASVPFCITYPVSLDKPM